MEIYLAPLPFEAYRSRQRCLMTEQLPGRQAMRMRALGRGRLCLRGQPPVSLAGRFSGRGILERDYWLLLLADYYDLTTMNITAEAQSTRRTNGRRRLLLRSSALFFQVLTNK